MNRQRNRKTYSYRYGTDGNTGRISRCSVLCKDVSEIGKLVREYNEELRAWENQTEQKKEPSSEPPKKASIRENCTAISRKADSSRNGQLKRNLWIENDKKGGNDYEENNF